MSRVPRYIVKCLRKKYVRTLVNNKSFFAMPAGFYWYGDKGKGDKDEALCSSVPWEPMPRGIQVKNAFKGYDVPIFCCYCIEENDVKDNTLLIKKRFIDEFLKDDNVALVFKYTDFLESINSCDSVQYHGFVSYYKELTPELEIEMMTRNGKPLLYKSHEYSYQNEYRIAFKDSIKPQLKANESDGVLLSYSAEDGKPYSFMRALSPIAELSAKDFINSNEYGDHSELVMSVAILPLKSV